MSLLWSGRRDSDPRHPTWKDGALPTELPTRMVGTKGILPFTFHVAFWRDPSTLHRFRARKAAVGIYLHTAVFTSILLTLLTPHW